MSLVPDDEGASLKAAVIDWMIVPDMQPFIPVASVADKQSFPGGSTAPHHTAGSSTSHQKSVRLCPRVMDPEMDAAQKVAPKC